MKLNKWQCGRCGFEWFEAAKINRGNQNNRNSCPRGCDDPGRVIDSVESTSRRNEWICWILCKEDIDMVAGKIGVKNNELIKDKYETIARSFIDGLQWANEDWEEILEDAVEDAVEDALQG